MGGASSQTGPLAWVGSGLKASKELQIQMVQGLLHKVESFPQPNEAAGPFVKFAELYRTRGPLLLEGGGERSKKLGGANSESLLHLSLPIFDERPTVANIFVVVLRIYRVHLFGLDSPAERS